MPNYAYTKLLKIEYFYTLYTQLSLLKFSK